MSSLSVLVVDDSPFSIRKVEAALAELGHKVVKTASTGEEAITAFGECNPDLVTMDITMPGMDGIAATRAIVSRYPNAQIVMVTSHGHEGKVLESLKAGAKGYIIKPVKAAALKTMIGKLKPS